MALSDEQRALLQLLLEGGQGYEDIGSLLGVSADEARSRAGDALREIGGADPDSQVQLSDYLLGQADPIGRADAVRFLQNDPDANALAAVLVSQLRLIAPRAELPEIPAPRGRAAAPRPGAAPDGHPPAGRKGDLAGRLRGVGSDKRQSQLLVGVGALLLLVVVGLLAIAGVFGGSDEGGDDDASSAAEATDELVIAQLGALQSGSDASGQATFAQVQDQPVLQLNLNDLEPTGEDQIYVVWLYASDRIAFPIARDQVGENGSLTGAAPISSDIAPLVGQFRCVDVSLATPRETERAIQAALQGGGIPRHAGESVLRGEIPDSPGATAPSGADSECSLPTAPQTGQGQGGGQGGAGQGGGAQGSGQAGGLGGQ